MTLQADQLPGVGPAPKPQGVSAATIRDALQRHYSKPGTPRDGEILISEVEAPASTRRADLVRVGMWKSRGTGVDVHEIKTSRSDWLRELDNPAKAEAWWPYCNRFWVVTVPGVVGDGELPEGWGLMEMPASGRRFKVRVPAVTRKGIQLTVPLLVELLRRTDNLRLAEMDVLRQKHRDDLWHQEAAARARSAKASIPFEVQERLDLLQEIENAIGVPLDRFGGWPKIPLKSITPAELAAFLADIRDHVTLQRRADAVEREQDSLRTAATAVLRRLDGVPGSRRPGG